MCTLTYLPEAEGYTFTHNRDERADRPTTRDIQMLKLDDQEVYFPQDLEAYGSWIAYSSSGRAVCLLNGGSKPHQRKERYRHSRGLVVLDNFRYTDQPLFYKEYDLRDIEPFTLIIRDNTGLWKITHDTDDTSIEELDAGITGIWSSTTLYTRDVREKREHWFEDWLKTQNSPDPAHIRAFHQSAGDGDSENDLIMSRWGILQTLSITQVHVHNGTAIMRYDDLMRNTTDQVQLQL